MSGFATQHRSPSNTGREATFEKALVLGACSVLERVLLLEDSGKAQRKAPIGRRGRTRSMGSPQEGDQGRVCEGSKRGGGEGSTAEGKQ